MVWIRFVSKEEVQSLDAVLISTRELSLWLHRDAYVNEDFSVRFRMLHRGGSRVISDREM